MLRLGSLALALMLGSYGATLGCVQVGTFACIDDAECQGDGLEGRCLASGCAHPDPECDSSERYSRYAMADVAGRCVPETEPGSTSVATSTSDGDTSGDDTSDDGSSSTTGPPPPPEECNGIDDDGDGLIDEWSPFNTECEICLMPDLCRSCHLFVDDEVAPTTTYWYCRGDAWAELPVFCKSLDQPGDPQVGFVSIHDDAENQLIVQQLPLDPQGWGITWIGMRNAGSPEAPQWVWDDGSEVDYHQLGSNFDGYDGGDTCVSLNDSGNWGVNGCLAAFSFVCEAAVR